MPYDGAMLILPVTRLASVADAGDIARMSRSYIEQGLGWSWTTPRVLRSIRDRGSNVVIADDPTRRLGFGIMKYRDDEAHLLLLAVAPLHVLNSHYVKHDVPVTLLIVLAYLAYDRLWSLPPKGGSYGLKPEAAA